MIQQDEKANNSSIHRLPDQMVSDQHAAAVITQATVPSIAADRLYQLATLTAGVFLLATLL